jgi:hypothetical protein
MTKKIQVQIKVPGGREDLAQITTMHRDPLLCVALASAMKAVCPPRMYLALAEVVDLLADWDEGRSLPELAEAESDFCYYAKRLVAAWTRYDRELDLLAEETAYAK